MLDQLAHFAVGAVIVALVVLVHPVAGVAVAALLREIEQGVVRNRALHNGFDRAKFVERYSQWKHLRGKLNDWSWYIVGAVACSALL